MTETVECPRERCEGGTECLKDHHTGRVHYVMCYFCKGHGLVSDVKAARYRAASLLGPPPTPPVPLSER